MVTRGKATKGTIVPDMRSMAEYSSTVHNGDLKKKGEIKGLSDEIKEGITSGNDD
jgi:hypothetical protein